MDKPNEVQVHYLFGGVFGADIEACVASILTVIFVSYVSLASFLKLCAVLDHCSRLAKLEEDKQQQQKQFLTRQPKCHSSLLITDL